MVVGEAGGEVEVEVEGEGEAGVVGAGVAEGEDEAEGEVAALAPTCLYDNQRGACYVCCNCDTKPTDSLRELCCLQATGARIPAKLVELIPPKYRSAMNVGNSADEIARWRAERRKNYPSTANVKRKVCMMLGMRQVTGEAVVATSIHMVFSFLLQLEALASQERGEDSNSSGKKRPRGGGSAGGEGVAGGADMAEGSSGAGGSSGGGTAAVAPAATAPGFSLVAYSDSDGSGSDAGGSGGEDAPSSVANARPHAAQYPMPPAPPPPSTGGAPTDHSGPQQGMRVRVGVQVQLRH